MTEIYARDLHSDLKTDSFMGKGFEKALAEAEANDEDLVIGTFDDSPWRSS